MNTRTSISILAAMALFGTNCTDNNSSNNTQDQGKDMPDMRTDMGGDDMPETQSLSCAVISTSPRTLPIGGAAADVQWTVACNQALSADMLKGTFRGNALEFKAGGDLACEVIDKQHVCTFTTTNITPPSETMPEKKIEQISVSIGDMVMLNTPIHWHLDIATLEQERVPLIKSLDTDGGQVIASRHRRRPERLRAVYREVLRSTELRVAGPSTTPTGTTFVTEHSISIPTESSDLLAQGFEVLDTASGGVEALWWGFDAKKRTFLGLSIGLDGDGKKIYEKVHDAELPLDADKTLAKVIDVRAVPVERAGEGGTGVGLLLVGLTAENKVTFHQPFEKDGQRGVVPSGEFFGLDESKMNQASFGFVEQLGNVGDRFDDGSNSYFLVWSALPNATKDKTLLSIMPTFRAEKGEQPSITLDTGFEAKDIYVDQIKPGKISVLLHGERDQRAMFLVDYDVQTNTVTKTTPLALPADVDTRPSCRSDKDKTKNEKDKWVCEDGALTCSDGKGCGVTDHFKVMGRWPWNWRELKELKSQSDKQSMVVTWNGTDNTLIHTHPVLLEKMPADVKSGQVAVVTEVDNGRGVAIQTGSLDPDSCKTKDDCRVAMDVPRLSVGQGTNGPQIYFEGDNGPLVLSRKRAKHMRTWAMISSAESDDVVLMASVAPEKTDSVATFGVWWYDAKNNKVQGPALIKVDATGADFDQDTILEDVVIHKPGETQEIVLMTRSGVLKEGAKPSVTITRLPYTGLVEATGNTSSDVVVEALSAPVNIELHPSALPTETQSLQVALYPCLSDEEYSDIYRRSLPESTTTTVLNDTASTQLMAIYPDPQDGKMTMKAVDGDGTKYVGLGDLIDVSRIKKTGDENPKLRLVKKSSYSGKNDRLFVASPGYAFLISRRKAGPTSNHIDAIQVNFPVALDQSPVDEMTFDTGDYNGDGIADTYVLTGLDLTMPDTATTGVIFFGDGLGGYLPAAMPLMGAPSRVWTIDAKPGFGSGTRKSTTRASSRAELQ